jgi:L-proline---[L-prolyl-carrier protein] ligase
MHVLYKILLTLKKKNKAQILIVDGDRKNSTAYFIELINKISSFLLIQNIPKNSRIALCMKRGVESIAVVYSVLNHDCCYIPLDVSNPPTRLLQILKLANIKYIIGEGAKPSWCENCRWIDINQIILLSAKFDFLLNKVNLESKYIFDSESIACILHTSGSTGTPKGIAISHRALMKFVQWTIDTFLLSKNDSVLDTTPLNFDLSFFNIFSSIQANAQLNIAPNSAKMFPHELTTFIKKNMITIWYTVPSLLCYWSSKCSADTNELAHLRVIMFAGEKMPKNHLQFLAKKFYLTSFYNLYGPAETNVCCYWKVDLRELTNHDIPIGKPACNAELRLDRKGELLVKTPCLSSGYTNKDCLQDLADKDRWYHTGDCCSLNDNNFIFHNRFDRMFKSYGHRIEPSEIESVAMGFFGIEKCLVVAIDDDFNNKRSVLFFTANNNVNLTEFKSFLQENLASYMYPVKIIRLDSMPIFSNGKTNLQELVRLANYTK